MAEPDEATGRATPPDWALATEVDEDLPVRVTRRVVKVVSTEATPSRVGRFDCLQTLGRGGMGVVMAAYDPRLQRKIALKLLDRATLSPTLRDDALREARAMARLSHPNVVAVYEVGEVDDTPYIAMELIEGRTLREWLTVDGTTGPDRLAVLRMFLDIANGLVAAHDAGIVHRDLKPDNVLVGDDGRPRIVDFGLSRGPEGFDGAEPEGRGPSTRRIVGTPAYMAAEQWSGAEVDARTDQFAFCVALHHALYGRAPFEGSTVAELGQRVIEGQPEPIPPAERVAAPLHQAILRGLDPEPSRRWASMRELAEVLRDTIHRAQPGLFRAVPRVLLFAMGPLLLVISLTWLMLELLGVVEHAARSWLLVSLVQLCTVGSVALMLRRHVLRVVQTPRVLAIPGIIVPTLITHRVVVFVTGSSIELMFVYDFVLLAGAAWGVVLLLERAAWPMLVLFLSVATAGALRPAWTPYLWVIFTCGAPLGLAWVGSSARKKRNSALLGRASRTVRSSRGSSLPRSDDRSKR